MTISSQAQQNPFFALQEVVDGFSQIGGTFGTGISTLSSQLGNAIKNGVIDYSKVVAPFLEQFRWYSNQAQMFASRAEASGNLIEAQVFRDWGNYYAQRAKKAGCRCYPVLPSVWISGEVIGMVRSG